MEVCTGVDESEAKHIIIMLKFRLEMQVAEHMSKVSKVRRQRRKTC